MNPAIIRTLITIIWIALPIGCLIIAVKTTTSGVMRVVLVIVAVILLLALGGCYWVGTEFGRTVQ